MNSIEIVKTILKPIISKKKCLDVAIDSGLGRGMKIEKWILIEMLSNLIELRDQNKLKKVEGEHKYLQKKGTRYEHCDLWWTVNDEEHWLEVKTIVMAKDEQKGKLEEVEKDLEKIGRLGSNVVFHHLSMVFPLDIDEENDWKIQLNSLYTKKGFKYKADWHYEIWDEKVLLNILYTKINKSS